MKFNKVLLASVAVLSLTGGALAADLVLDSSYTDPAADWSGVYVGINAGAGLLSANVPGYDAVYYGSDYGNVDANGWGLTVGVGVGANMQIGSFVLGIDGDINWSNLSADVNIEDGYYNSSASWDWYATLRAKAGVAVDNALIYATAGVAAVNTTYGACYYADCSDTDSDDFAYSQTVFGFAAGAGAEVKVTDNMSVKGEVLYIGLPTTAYLNDNDYWANFASSATVARVGLNWSF